MKKICVLTSMLALAACGGGGHGGWGGSNMDLTIPTEMRSAVSSDVAASNEGITGMKSEVLVASADGKSVVVSREASKQNGAGVVFTSYRLDDIKLYTAEELGANPEERNTYLNFHLDENTGEINAIKMYVGGVDSGYITRSVEDNHYANTFNGPIFEYVEDGDDRAVFRVVDTGQITMDQLNDLANANGLSGGHWNRIDEMMDFKTYGKESGLKYADFGYFNPVYKSKNKELTPEVLAAVRSGRDAVIALGRGEDKDKMRTDEDFQKELDKQDYQLFAGGYAISGTEMDKSLKPERSTSFKGTAIGRVYASVQAMENNGVDESIRARALDYFHVPTDNGEGYTNDAGHDMSKLYTTNEATMTIDANGNSVLIMPFNTNAAVESDKFYDIEISQNNNNIVTGVKFTGNENLIAEQYREQGSLGLDPEGNVDMAKIAESNFTSGYYGVNEPVEAAGTAFLQANDFTHTVHTDTPESHDYQFRREYEVQAAWGMKKQ